MRRVSVVGSSGSGKSTFAAALARKLGVPHVELDALYHGPGWTPAEPRALQDAVDAVVAGEGWVVDGNYGAVRDRVWARADAVIWLDLPRSVVIPALIRRTLRRGLRRQVLWNGNRERPWQIFDPRPEHNVVLWSWTHHEQYSGIYSVAANNPANPPVVRLRSRAEIAAFLAADPTSPPPGPA